MADKKLNFVAIDFGTSKTRIYIQGEGVVFDEPTIYAIDTKTRKVIAIGKEAKQLEGRTSENSRYKVVRPFKNGIVTDAAGLRTFLEVSLEKYTSYVKGSIILLACPLSVTKLERKAFVKIVREQGAYYVQVEDDIKLASLAAGIKIEDAEGYLVLDLGAGKTTAAVISLGDVVLYKWTKIAGITFDEEIVKYVKSKLGVEIPLSIAEKIKIELGSLLKNKNPLKMKVGGREVTSGMPIEVIVSDVEINKTITHIFTAVTSLITSVLEETPNELAVDIVKNGIIVTGGMARILGIKDYLEDFFEIPVRVVKNSTSATIDGALVFEPYVRNELDRRVREKEKLFDEG